VTRRFFVPPAFLLVALLTACGGQKPTSSESIPASPPADAAADQAQEAVPESQDPAPLVRTSVTLYFPSATGDRLAAEIREIVETRRPADRGAQILTALLAGPQTEDALPAVPPGTTLRQLWVRDDGNAYVDFSEEFMSAATGGSADQILTVYAIVNSLTENVRAIRRVGILVAGRERPTFGHLDLSRPLPPDLTLAAAAKATE
jgi:spore germination protein GerM